MKPELPEARIAGRGDRDGVLRGIGIALAVGAATVVASWSLILAFVFVGLGVGGGGLWLFRLHLEARDQRSPVAAPALPAGTCEYALRPRLSAIAVMIISLVICLVVIRWPELAELPIIGALTLCAAGAGLLVMFVLIRASILRQRVVVTERHVRLPSSRWSRQEKSIALEHVWLHTWGPDSSPILEISSFGDKFDVGMAYVGERAFGELVAVLEQRIAQAKAATRRESGDRS